MNREEKAIMKRITLLNMASGLILQFFTIISGFVVPRIVLSYFGSDVNGLVSSLNQFLGYITLIEGGVTGVITANLYKPLVEKDMERVSSVLVTAKKFYKKIGFIFIAYTIGLALLYPVVFNNKFSYSYVASLTLILSMMLMIQYLYSITLRTLLFADKKGYVVSITQTGIVILNMVLVYLSVKVYPSIHILKLISGSLFILQPLVFSYYIKKNYSISWDAVPNNKLIKERWNGFAINIAAFIHNGTDIAILTIFTDLKMVSIYSVYALVTSGLKQLITSCVSGISHTVGQTYAKGNEEELNLKLDLYEYIIFTLVTGMFTLAALLITPFVLLYTKGVTDAEYYQPIFGVLLILSEAFYIIKFPHLDLSYSANKFKEITFPAYIEAAINITVSVVLVKFFGLTGVTVGTILAMIYRMAFHIRFTKVLIPSRNQWIFYRKLVLFGLVSLISYFTCSNMLPMKNITVISWIVHASEYACIVATLVVIMSLVFFKKELAFFIRYLRR